MSDQNESIHEDVIALENALKSLTPSRGRLDRDAVMFHAGRESARRPFPFSLGRRCRAAADEGDNGEARTEDPHPAFGHLLPGGEGKNRFWIAAAAALAAVALGEGVLLANRPAPTVVERIVVVQADPPAPPAPVVEPEKVRENPVASAPRPTFGPGRTPHDRLTWQVLRYGLDGLPAPVKSAWTDREPHAETSRQMLEAELLHILETGDPS